MTRRTRVQSARLGCQDRWRGMWDVGCERWGPNDMALVAWGRHDVESGGADWDSATAEHRIRFRRTIRLSTLSLETHYRYSLASETTIAASTQTPALLPHQCHADFILMDAPQCSPRPAAFKILRYQTWTFTVPTLPPEPKYHKRCW